ncbi:MAG: hypothetical protein J5865_06345 [Lachnospiraceae bacterium]|nr:hypothetical protein [Lachnospiraceae bacterium]
MAEIRFGDLSPGWQRTYRIIQLCACIICVAVLILTLILWDLKYIPIVFFAAAVSNAVEMVDRFRKKTRSSKRQVGWGIVFLVLALICLVLTAAGIYLLWR